MGVVDRLFFSFAILGLLCLGVGHLIAGIEIYGLGHRLPSQLAQGLLIASLGLIIGAVVILFVMVFSSRDST